MKASNSRFFGTWAVLFVAGILLLLYAPGAWPALGMIIVAPTVIAIALMSWGWLVCKVIAACGGDPDGDSVGIWIFLSFAFFVVPLVIAFHERRR